MRLIKDEGQGNLHLIEYHENEIPLYAILSHTWGEDDEEVTFQDFTGSRNKRKAGWKKIDFCRKQAAIDKIEHFWIDTCCIKKENLTELSEAINSMFRWYQCATKCYVYLADVSINRHVKTASSVNTQWEVAFGKSRWFRRGWTLQELIALTSVEFFSKEGHCLGCKRSLEWQINGITGIAVEALRGRSLTEFSVDERFDWAESRETRRQEDKAYSTLGIFDTHMSLIYGEGKENAIRRLRGKICKSDAKMSTEEHSCLQSFCPSGIDYEAQKNQNLIRVPDTCLWTLRNPKNLEWRDTDIKKLLWISADPGCGKSVLARCIIDEDLPTVSRGDWPQRVLYYFFKDTNSEQRSAAQAIFSVLHQLFVSHPQLIRHALPKYKVRGTALSSSFSELWSIFTAAATDPAAGDIVCVLDALDECNDQDLSNLIKYLVDFCLCLQSSSRASHLKFLVTSRPYFAIRQGFDKVLEVSNNIELAGNDESANIKKEIDLVVKDQVAKLKRVIRLPQKVSDHLERKLLQTEHRTYLWLHLLWKIIRKNLSGTKSEMDDLIDNLLDDIQTSYEALIYKCPNPVFAKRVLQIVLIASRPLTLAEIDVALHVTEQTSSCADLEIEGPSRLQEMLPSRCGLMVSIIQSKVYFIHQTVKEFLLSKAGIKRPVGKVWQQSLDLEESHHLLAQICLRSISFSEVELHQTSLCNAVLPEEAREMEPNTYCRSHIFLSYSAVYWADHFRDQKSNKGIESVEYILKNSDCRSVIGRWDHNYGTILHAASLGGHKKVVQMLLEKGANVNAQGGLYNNALQAASFGDHEKVVQMLLKKGVDVNVQGGVYGNTLQAASWAGREKVVQILLENGANVNAQGGLYDNALQAASKEGYETVIQMLLERGAIRQGNEIR